MSLVESSVTVRDCQQLFQRIRFTNSCLVDKYINTRVIRVCFLEDHIDNRVFKGFYCLDTYHSNDVQPVWNDAKKKVVYTAPKFWFLLDEEALAGEENIAETYRRRIIDIDLSPHSKLDKGAKNDIRRVNSDIINDVVVLNTFRTYIEING